MANLGKIAHSAFEYMRSVCPQRSGNMHNTMMCTQQDPNTWVISIGGEKAPYAVYTNEKWVSPKWHGKQNPNEHWIDQGVTHVVAQIASSLGGELNYNQSEVDNRLANKSYWDSEEGKQKLKEYNML